jgi:Uma2 family endonuclease
LPDGSVRSSDGAWANSDKVNALSPEERKKFASLVPDFVIEIRSSSDRLSKLKSKMKDTWIKNGVRLAWLIDPIARKAYIYRADGSEEVIPNFNHVLSGEDVCPGFQLDLKTLNF